MLIKTPDSYITMPWKNGGGITHEILKREQAGKLQWRFSIAEVASDGPFSIFGGMSRILTVFEGDGLVLSTPTGKLDVRPLQPVAFSGDWPITCLRRGDLVTDFNVIFDALSWRAAVTIQPAHSTLSITCAANQIHAALVLGQATIDSASIPPRSLICLDSGTVEVESGGPIIHVILDAL
jgi:uncharacterized protein